MADFPLLNDVEPSWADIKISLPIHDGETVQTSDIQSVSWSDTVEVGLTRGTSGGAKRKRTTGEYDCEGTLVLYKSGWRVFRDALAARAAALGFDKRISLVGFDVLIQHTPPGSSDIDTVKLVGARVIGRSSNPAEGTDPDQVEVALSIMRIEEADGVSLL